MFLFELSFPKPTFFKLKKSFLDKNTVLSLKKTATIITVRPSSNVEPSHVPKLMHNYLNIASFQCHAIQNRSK